ncbi:MAG: glutaredoxin domain-containing protein [Candidatus Woesearchaeota archaeon]
MDIKRTQTLKIFILAFLLLTAVTPVAAQEGQSETTVYFFWGEGCPHCATEKPFLEEMEQEYPEVEVKMFETWKNPENAGLFQELARAYGFQARGVPTTFIGEEHWVGYNDAMGEEMEAAVQDCIENGCPDPAETAGVEEEASLLAQETRQEESAPDDTTQAGDQSAHETNTTCMHLFLDENCTDCAELEAYLEQQDYEDVHLVYHYVSNGSEEELYDSFKETYGVRMAGYPALFSGDNYLIGQDAIKDNIDSLVKECEEKTCPCPAENIKGITPGMPEKSYKSESQEQVELPLLGVVNLSYMPTYVTTAIIAFIDGFNPCSLWLITFLLGIVIYSNSRKKILTVGGTFLLVTGIAYALFMAGLLNVFLYVGYLSWIQVIVALMAFIFATVNIKDYFWYKKGISFTIPDKYKPKIFKNMRHVMKSDKSFGATVIGTAVLALGVVLVELPCTAGFPLIWSNMMAQNQIQGFAFLIHLLLYMVIYLSIEIIIILAALITMKSARFEEKHGRILKLIGGMIMLALGLVMLINPDLMNRIGTTLLIFGGAIGASFLLIFIHRKVLPKFGITIGSEKLKEDDKDEDSE